MAQSSRVKSKYYGEGPEFLPIYDDQDFSNSYFWLLVWEPNGNLKQVAGFDNSME